MGRAGVARGRRAELRVGGRGRHRPPPLVRAHGGRRPGDGAVERRRPPGRRRGRRAGRRRRRPRCSPSSGPRDVAPLVHGGNSGAALLRAVRPDGTAFVLKRVTAGADWLARATRDDGPHGAAPRRRRLRGHAGGDRARASWRSRATVRRRGSPCATSARSCCPRTRGCRERRAGASSTPPPRSTRASAARRPTAPRPCATASACPPRPWRDAERADPDLLPKQFEHGWDAFAEVVAADVAEPVLALAREPAPLADALIAAHGGPTLIHGDLRDDNLGFDGDRVVLIDWDLATAGTPTAEFAWYLAQDAWRIDATHDELEADHRAAQGDGAGRPRGRARHALRARPVRLAARPQRPRAPRPGRDGVGPRGARLVGSARAPGARARGRAGGPTRREPQRGADRMTSVPATAWPPLPYREWEPTKQTLHRYVQMVGKLRMSLVPFRNHWWHVTLYVSAHGLTTGPMPAGDRTVEVELDFVEHRVQSARAPAPPPASPCATACRAPTSTATCPRRSARWGSTPSSGRRPFDLGDSPPFPDDREHDSYDADAVERYVARAAAHAGGADRLRGAVQRQGEPDPAVLALLRPRPRALLRPPRARPRGRRPGHRGGLLARGHLVGLVAGRRPPHALPRLLRLHRARAGGPARAAARPAEAVWTPTGNGSLAVLPYDVVRESADPAGMLLDFFEARTRPACGRPGGMARRSTPGRSPRP